MRASPLLHVTVELDDAIRVVCELAQAGGALTCAELAQRTHVPVRHLSGLLQKLRRGGIVRRRARAGGGFELVDGPERLGVARVVAAVQGSWIGAPPGGCDRTADERLGGLWQAVERDLLTRLTRVTVADLCARRFGAALEVG